MRASHCFRASRFTSSLSDGSFAPDHRAQLPPSALEPPCAFPLRRPACLRLCQARSARSCQAQPLQQARRARQGPKAEKPGKSEVFKRTTTFHVDQSALCESHVEAWMEDPEKLMLQRASPWQTSPGDTRRKILESIFHSQAISS